MGDRISLRAIFLVTATVAIASLLVRLAMVSQGRTMVLAALTCLAMPVVIFALYGLLYLFLLPFGILSEITRENLATPTSPFATHRLPENQLPPSEPDRAH